MNKIVKLLIGLGVLLAGDSLFYYFVVFLPTLKLDQENRKLIESCQIAALRLAKETHDGDGSRFPPMYKYDVKLKKCFLRTGVFYVQSGVTIEEIFDVDTGQTVANYVANNGKVTMGDADDFKERRQEIFGK